MSIGLSLSDFISIPQFAWSVYQTCRDCTYEYHALGNEVASLHAVLSEVTDKLSDCELTIQSAERLAFLGKGCQDVLKKVEKTIASYNALKSTDVTLIARLRRGKKRIKWALEAPEKIRAQLLIQISLLNLFNSSLILSSVRSVCLAQIQVMIVLADLKLECHITRHNSSILHLLNTLPD